MSSWLVSSLAFIGFFFAAGVGVGLSRLTRSRKGRLVFRNFAQGEYWGMIAIAVVIAIIAVAVFPLAAVAHPGCSALGDTSRHTAYCGPATEADPCFAYVLTYGNGSACTDLARRCSQCQNVNGGARLTGCSTRANQCNYSAGRPCVNTGGLLCTGGNCTSTDHGSGDCANEATLSGKIVGEDGRCANGSYVVYVIDGNSHFNTIQRTDCASGGACSHSHDPLTDTGCRNSTAANYDSCASVDDPSICRFIYGCLNSSAQNYNPLATMGTDATISAELPSNADTSSTFSCVFPPQPPDPPDVPDVPDPNLPDPPRYGTGTPFALPPSIRDHGFGVVLSSLRQFGLFSDPPDYAGAVGSGFSATLSELIIPRTSSIAVSELWRVSVPDWDIVDDIYRDPKNLTMIFQRPPVSQRQISALAGFLNYFAQFVDAPLRWITDPLRGVGPNEPACPAAAGNLDLDIGNAISISFSGGAGYSSSGVYELTFGDHVCKVIQPFGPFLRAIMFAAGLVSVLWATFHLTRAR